jgi:hypothetical protein
MANEIVHPTFVNTLVVNGHLNGIVNLSFSYAHWFPHSVEGEVKISVTEPIVLDLRMDLATAQAVHAALGTIIETNTKPTPKDSVN